VQESGLFSRILKLSQRRFGIQDLQGIDRLITLPGTGTKQNGNLAHVPICWIREVPRFFIEDELGAAEVRREQQDYNAG
jgi:hypothetical protein